jgi:hypothetical protein
MSHHSPELRDTKYATEIARSVISSPGGDEARIERLRIKATDQIEIRLSWWKNGQMLPRPLDLTEADFLKLVVLGIRDGVLFPPDAKS